MARYSNADLYQMLAYCTAPGLPLGHFVYATATKRTSTWFFEGAESNWTRLRLISG